MDDDHGSAVVPVDPDLADRATVPPQGATGSTRWLDHLQPGVLLVIAAGGALGAPARYALEEAFRPRPGRFPAATFAINVSGAFVLGLFLVLVIEWLRPSRYLRPLVATGFLGAFTTFSTFAVELLTLGRDGHVPMAVWYATATMVAGLTAAKVGMASARRLRPRSSGPGAVERHR